MASRYALYGAVALAGAARSAGTGCPITRGTGRARWVGRRRGVGGREAWGLAFCSSKPTACISMYGTASSPKSDPLSWCCSLPIARTFWPTRRAASTSRSSASRSAYVSRAGRGAPLAWRTSGTSRPPAVLRPSSVAPASTGERDDAGAPLEGVGPPRSKKQGSESCLSPGAAPLTTAARPRQQLVGRHEAEARLANGAQKPRTDVDHVLEQPLGQLVAHTQLAQPARAKLRRSQQRAEVLPAHQIGGRDRRRHDAIPRTAKPGQLRAPEGGLQCPSLAATSPRPKK